MDCCCDESPRCCASGYRRDVVNAYAEQARSFATVGLLRHVTDATPLDFISAYIINTYQPYGLIDIAYNIFGRYNRVEREPFNDVFEVKRSNVMRHIPDSLVKMAKEYLVRAFWKEIDKIRLTGYKPFDGASTFNGYKRMLPKSVLDVLGSIYIQPHASLYDIRNAITSLHAVVTPTLLDTPAWMNKEGRDVNRSMFDTCKVNHERNVRILVNVLDQYCYTSSNKNHIPNAAEKNLLLDILEIFLIMFGPCEYSDNYYKRQVYEYSKMGGNVMSENAGRGILRNGGNYSFNNGYRGHGWYNSNWRDGANLVLDNLQGLSPEAALCVGVIESDWRRFANVVTPETLAKLNKPIPEVKLFLSTEFEIQQKKINEAESISRKYAKGELTEYFSSTVEEECIEEPSHAKYN